MTTDTNVLDSGTEDSGQVSSTVYDWVSFVGTVEVDDTQVQQLAQGWYTPNDTWTTWVGGSYIGIGNSIASSTAYSSSDTELKIGTTGLTYGVSLGGSVFAVVDTETLEPDGSPDQIDGILPLDWLSGLEKAWLSSQDHPSLDDALRAAQSIINQSDAIDEATLVSTMSDGAGTDYATVYITDVDELSNFAGSGYVVVDGTESNAESIKYDSIGNADNYLNVSNSYTPGSHSSGASIRGHLGTVQDAVAFGTVHQTFIMGHTFTWDDGYDFRKVDSDDYQEITLGSHDQLNVSTEISDAIDYRVGEIDPDGFRGGAWPFLKFLGTNNFSDQDEDCSDYVLEFHENFLGQNNSNSADDVLNDYTPEHNFAIRVFGHSWHTETGNQVTWGQGSSDFNFGPQLSYAYYTQKCPSTVEIELDSETLFKDLEAKSADFGLEKSYTSREDMLADGLSETYEVCAPDEIMYSYSRGNSREVTLQGDTGQLREYTLLSDGVMTTGVQRKSLYLTVDGGSATETTNVSGTSTVSESNGVSIATSVAFAKEEFSITGMTLGGPLKSGGGWRKWSTMDDWKTQGVTANIDIGPFLLDSSTSLYRSAFGMVVKPMTPTFEVLDWDVNANSYEWTNIGELNSSKISLVSQTYDVKGFWNLFMTKGIQSAVGGALVDIGLMSAETEEEEEVTAEEVKANMQTVLAQTKPSWVHTGAVKMMLPEISITV